MPPKKKEKKPKNKPTVKETPVPEEKNTTDKKTPSIVSKKDKKVIKKTLKRGPAKKALPPIGEELKEIYEEEGEMPDMTKLERRRPRWWLAGIFILLILGAISAAIYAGWVFWRPWEKPQKGGIDIEIAGPSQAVNGERIIYKINYKNQDKVPMAAVEMQANLPKGFNVLLLEPEPTGENNTWQIGSLDVGDSGSIKIEGYLLEEVKTSHNIQALVTYRPANFSSDFQGIETLSVLVQDSKADLVIEGPTKAVPGDEVEYTIKFKNTSEFNYENLELQAAYPEGFIFNESEPAPMNEAGSRWRFDALATNTEEVVRVKGSFASQGQGLQDMVFRLGMINGGIFKLQKEETLQAEVLAGDLVTHLFINGSESNQSLNFGENLRFSLTFDNTSGEKMEDIELTVHVESDPKVGDKTLVEWDNLVMPDEKSGRKDGQTITWDKAVFEALGELEADAGDSIDFSMPLIGEPLSTLEGKYEVQAWVEAKIGKIGEGTTEREIQSSPITLSINTDAGFSATGRYFNEEGETLGFGPLPPEIGEVTGYHIFWNITNSLHEIQDIRVTTTLPQNVSWTGRKQVGAGELNYNESTHQVTWTINRLPTSITDITTSFEVSVRPREDDLGTFVKLTTESTFEAIDQKTNDSIIISKDPISTDIPWDDLAKGKGVVVEGED